MGRRLIGDRIPKQENGALDHWAAQKCELCGRELGYEDAIRLGRGEMGYQHLRCSFERAVKALRYAANTPADAANIATDAMIDLGESFKDPNRHQKTMGSNLSSNRSIVLRRIVHRILSVDDYLDFTAPEELAVPDSGFQTGEDASLCCSSPPEGERAQVLADYAKLGWNDVLKECLEYGIEVQIDGLTYLYNGQDYLLFEPEEDAG